MSNRFHLHTYVHQRFREAFGEPDNTLGRDDHWSLTPSREQPAINVLVDGTGETPAVWVFDPHIKDDGVMQRAVKKEDDVAELIEKIQQQVEQAKLKRSQAGCS